MDRSIGPLSELAREVPVHGVFDLPLDDVLEDLKRNQMQSRKPCV